MLLRTEKLKKTFGGLIAVNEIDFSIEAGTIAAIIGPNGSGKTTLMWSAGFCLPAAAKIFFNDRDVTAIGARDTQRWEWRGPSRISACLPTLPPRQHHSRSLQPDQLRAARRVVQHRACNASAGKRGQSRRTAGVCRAGKSGRPHGQKTCLTERSADWRSLGPWPANRNCCCSTSRPPA